MSNTTTKLSLALPEIADIIEQAIFKASGERIGFSLMVFTPDRASYISNCERSDVIPALAGLLDHWQAGQLDVPAHKIN